MSNTLGRLSELKFPGPGQERLKDLDGLEGLEEGRYWARLFDGLEEVLWGLSLRGGEGGGGEGESVQSELDREWQSRDLGRMRDADADGWDSMLAFYP